MKLYQQDWNYRKNNTDKYPELKAITSYPNSFWLTRNPKKPKLGRKLTHSIRRLCRRAHPAQPVIVLYAIPGRDMGGHSKGGLTEKQYLKYVGDIALGIGNFKPIIIFEPDAIPHMRKMNFFQRTNRTRLIKKALDLLSNTNAQVYLDIGHPNWLKKTDAVTYLNLFNKGDIKGFSINVSNFVTTDKCLRYGDKISEETNLNYVIDTSRNGNEVWETFNPQDMKLGEEPTIRTNSRKCDAYLWIKTPGESDGAINGWPKAGRFNAEKTLEILK